MSNYELVKFVDDEFSLDVSVDYQKETVWLTQRQIAYLFDVSTDNIGLHIKNNLKENELDDSTAEESSVVQTEGKRHHHQCHYENDFEIRRPLVHPNKG